MIYISYSLNLILNLLLFDIPHNSIHLLIMLARILYHDISNLTYESPSENCLYHPLLIHVTSLTSLISSIVSYPLYCKSSNLKISMILLQIDNLFINNINNDKVNLVQSIFAFPNSLLQTKIYYP